MYRHEQLHMDTSKLEKCSKEVEEKETKKKIVERMDQVNPPILSNAHFHWWHRQVSIASWSSKHPSKITTV